MKEHDLLEFYRRLDRSFFLGDDYKDYAKADMPLPIGFDQTISQPSLVLLMTRLLELEKTSRVLEIGTGSGYQTAFLAEFSSEVYTIERIPELSKIAKQRLDALDYQNIFYKIGDGSVGWAENAPFDRIIVTASASKLPDELVQQLKQNGIMVIPIGPTRIQQLQVVTKDQQGNISINSIEPVRFVELKGKYGWSHQL